MEQEQQDLNKLKLYLVMGGAAEKFP